MDELPQLVSILKGDMSLIGPRALAVGEMFTGPDGDTKRIEEVPGFSARLAVRPGLTGPATVYLPKDAPLKDRFAYDLDYVERQALGARSSSGRAVAVG